MNTIQKRIEEAATFLFKQRGLDKESCRQAMYYILANQWISVEEALPVLVDKNSGQSEVVFAMTGYDNVFVAYYDYSNEHWYYNNHYGYDPQIYYEVTHWMPIPQN